MADEPNNAADSSSQQPQQPQQNAPAGQGFQPPVPPYGVSGQASGCQPPQMPPVYIAQPQPLQQLTGGMKFGWFAVGFLIGIAGILLAWLTNADKMPQVKSDALKWSIIGAVVGIALSFLSFTFLFGSVAALASFGASSGASFVW